MFVKVIKIKDFTLKASLRLSTIHFIIISLLNISALTHHLQVIIYFLLLKNL